jgi:hypothetical protein
MQALKLNVLAVVTSMASGCASITTSDTQSVMVTTRLQDGKAIEKAECKLSNDKGNWTVVSPGPIGVRRSADDMQIECSKDDTPKGLAKAISRAHGGMFGNIIFGGGIGAIIDHSSGNGYDYPDVIEVVMGANIVIDRHEQQAGTKRGATDTNTSREAVTAASEPSQR